MGPTSTISHSAAEPAAVESHRHPRELELAAEYRAYLFGGLRVYRQDEEAPLDPGGRRKALEILQWFLLHPGQPCSADQLIDLLWPDADAEKGATNLHVSLHALRRFLEPGLAPREESTFIRRHPNRVYTFEANGRWWSDVQDLELLYQRGHDFDLAGEYTKARFYYRRVAAYSGRQALLGADPAPWMKPFRRKFSMMCVHSLARLLEIDASVGDQEELLETAYTMLRLDPYHEPSVRAVVKSSLDCQDTPRAVELIAGYCAGLERDLGVRPPADLLQLCRSLSARGPSRHRSGQRQAPSGAVSRSQVGLPSVGLQQVG